MRAQALTPVVLVALVAAGCGGAKAARTGHTVTFKTAGAFPPATIVGRYSVPGCAHDAGAIVHDAQLYYAHSTTAPGPADLYYYDMRFDFAHSQADDCTSAQLGTALARGLTRRQRRFLLRNVANNLHRAFAAALDAAAPARGIAASPGPFVPSGGIAMGPQSGLWGDGSSGPQGTKLGCFAGRHYAMAVTLRNRSNTAVTLTRAGGPTPAPGIVERVAVQLRPAPPPPTGDLVQSPLRHWSAAPTRPVTIPPGRSAVVQSNFLMRDCRELTSGRTVTVPGSLPLVYRSGGHTRRQTVSQTSAGFVLVAGPTIRRCARVPGSVYLLAADVGCAAAKAAAPACHPMSHGSWGTCSAAGHTWDCGLAASSVERCWLPERSSHWLRVRWRK